uniref:Uncharacterized protein n=1 Tax=Knipowitschia caucasica TaxID=637954 RepID=A0AAV2KF87_KNICA
MFTNLWHFLGKNQDLPSCPVCPSPLSCPPSPLSHLPSPPVPTALPSVPSALPSVPSALPSVPSAHPSVLPSCISHLLSSSPDEAEDQHLEMSPVQYYSNPSSLHTPEWHQDGSN